MKTLVIHPKDKTTDFLSLIYKDKDYTVVNDCDIKPDVLRALIDHHDKIIMMGHGISQGLLNPKYGGLIIDDSFADLLRTKETISIWCFSDRYFNYHKIPGFHTGMIVSELAEQMYVLGKIYLNKEDQLENMERFATILSECIEMPPEKMKEYVLDHYTGDDEVTKFNRKNIRVL